jgi:hypothetical protein
MFVHCVQKYMALKFSLEFKKWKLLQICIYDYDVSF